MTTPKKKVGRGWRRPPTPQPAMKTRRPGLFSFHYSNIKGSPGSTWAGVAAIFGIVSSTLGASTHMPSTSGEWITLIVALVAGVGAIFSKGDASVSRSAASADYTTAHRLSHAD